MKLLLFLVLLCSFGLLTPVYPQKPRIENNPYWIGHNNIDYTAIGSEGDFEDGYMNLLFERQVNLALQTTYIKRAYRIITEAGVQNASEISVSYDPSFQQVTFHAIQILREGKAINKLNFSRIKTIQQEKELDRSIYNGALTAVLFLEDVRKGDIVEYAYSVRGFNPVFKGRYFSTFQVQYSIPVKNIFYKIVCPANRKLNIKNRLTNIEPVITGSTSEKTYEWKIIDPPVIKAQDQLPSWYDPFGEIMVSEFDNWQQVVQWALPLFNNKTPLSKELQKKVQEIKEQYDTPEKQVLAALRFVQDDIRYLGIEMGNNSHQPNTPNTIFARRFGDCKDKSFLLCTMLKALNVEAVPVLINTTCKKALQDWLPSPGAFNHATVRVYFNNKYYWFDPTISFQRGGIGSIAYPDYQCGLVLSDSAAALTNIPLQDTGKVVVKELFTMEDISGPAELTVTTRYSGSFADDIRSDINSNSKTELQKRYRDFYNSYYDGTSVKDSMRVQDDEATGNITVTEYYTVKHLWNISKGITKASFYGMSVSTNLQKPTDRDRTMPLAIAFPAHYIEEIEVRLPENWSFEETPVDVKSGSYHFSTSMFTTIRKIRLTIEYKALKDYVDTADSERFFSDYDTMKSALGYQLTQGKEVMPEKKEKVSDVVGTIVAALVILGVVIMIIIRALRR